MLPNIFSIAHVALEELDELFEPPVALADCLPGDGDHLRLALLCGQPEEASGDPSDDSTGVIAPDVPLDATFDEKWGSSSGLRANNAMAPPWSHEP